MTPEAYLAISVVVASYFAIPKHARHRYPFVALAVAAGLAGLWLFGYVFGFWGAMGGALAGVYGVRALAGRTGTRPAGS